MPSTLPPLSPLTPWTVIGGGAHDGEERTPAAPDVVADDGTWIAHAATAAAPLHITRLEVPAHWAAGEDALTRKRAGFVYRCVEVDGVRVWLYQGEYR